MLLRDAHRYVAEASDREGRRLGELLLMPDFVPSAEWSHLQGVRRGALPAFAHYGPGVIEPVFDEVLGRPFVVGIRVRFDAQDSSYEAPTIPWQYFQPCVEESAARLVREGALQAGEVFDYRICAFPVAMDNPTSTVPIALADEETPALLRLEPSDLASKLAGAHHVCQGAWNDADYPVFVQPELLAEATDMAHAAGERETGGILVGHLYRDTTSPEIHAEITAQIPASLADAGHAYLGFTPQTWSAVSDALALRGRHEIYFGWWHYHPFFCRRCDPARRRLCVLSRPFFSRDDRELHRVVFDTAFSVALLLSDIGEASLCYNWFGWRQGSIAARGCYLLDSDRRSDFSKRMIEDSALVARVLNITENPHEQ